MRVTFDVRFDHPVHEVFPYFAEPEKWLEYTPALVERTRLDEGPMRPGAIWRSVDRLGPVRVEFTDELVAVEPNRRVLWKQSAPWNSKAEYRVEADGEATVVHVHFEGIPTGNIRWLRLFPDWLSTKVYLHDMKTLAGVLAERGR
jgi:uncharacterized protein YndB with AHSA1/START domain